MNNFSITISGKPGSGKTSFGKMLAKALNIEFFSAGDFRGNIAKSKGLTIDELNELGKTEAWTDALVDEKIIELGKRGNIVIDSWIAFHFIPKSIKIFLDVDETLGAKRVMKSIGRDDEIISSDIETEKQILKKRYLESKARYQKYYDVNISDMSNYDILIDTTGLTNIQVLEKIKEILANFK